jgi:hypothetical protein
VIGIVAGRRCFDYYRLRKNGVLIEGIAHEARPHGQISYSFTINRNTYWGVGRIGVGIVPIEEIAQRHTVPIFYLPSSPTVNCLGNPGELYSNDIPIVLLVSLLFPTIIVGVIAFRLSKRGIGKE